MHFQQRDQSSSIPAHSSTRAVFKCCFLDFDLSELFDTDTRTINDLQAFFRWLEGGSTGLCILGKRHHHSVLALLSTMETQHEVLGQEKATALGNEKLSLGATRELASWRLRSFIAYCVWFWFSKKIGGGEEHSVGVRRIMAFLLIQIKFFVLGKAFSK